MLNGIVQYIQQILQKLFDMLGISGSLVPFNSSSGLLRVFIKYFTGKVIQVDLDPSWTIGKVKEIIAPKLNVRPDEVKIIFQGTQLPDHLVLDACDVGQQSYLHAVKVRVPVPPENQISSPIREGLSSHCPEHDILEHKEEFGNFPPGAVCPEGSTLPAKEGNVTPVVSRSRHYFFVYCNVCNDLNEGKLRVRCSICHSGAFTVNRHPEGWEDVLNKNRVLGNCQSQECSSESEGRDRFAEFFFRCNGHVTSGEDDIVPPLHHIKRYVDFINEMSTDEDGSQIFDNERSQLSCLSCGEDMEVSFVFPCHKSHSLCVNCFKDYAASKLNHREFSQVDEIGYTIGCPALCQDSWVGSSHHFKLLGRHDYDRYQRFATEDWVLQSGGILCPRPDCGMGIIPADNACNKIACLYGCGYVFCKLCGEGWHLGSCTSSNGTGVNRGLGQSFSAIRLNLQSLAQWEDATSRALRVCTKPCPKCRVPTERDGGCMHMECTKCKFQWCWVCQTQWDRECMANHWFG